MRVKVFTNSTFVLLGYATSVICWADIPEPRSWVNIPNPIVTPLREQAVLFTRIGRSDVAIRRLSQLHQQYPNDMRVVADLIVLLRQVGRNQEIVALTENLSPLVVPNYAIMPWASALRDTRLYLQSQRVLILTKGKLGVKAQILYAIVSAEGKQPDVALAALPKLDSKLDATDLAQIAYVYRLAKRPAQGLAMSQQARQKDANNVLAIRESVFALSDLRATGAAYLLATQHAALFSVEKLNQLKADNTAFKLRDAAAERDRLDALHQYQIRNQPLEDVLAEIDENLLSFPKDSPQYRNTEFDRIYVLRLLNRMPEVIEAYTHLPTNMVIPPYVKRAAADAYLANRQPKIAAKLYTELLSKESDASLSLSLYRALIDAEEYQQAAVVLDRLKRTTPTYAHVLAAGGKLPNWERLEVDQTVAMDAAYRNDLAGSSQQFADLFNQAPYSTGIIDDYATVLRWRGLPQAADRMTAIAETYEPLDLATRINVANNTSDLEQIPRWRKTIIPLYQDFPNDTAVQKNYAAWQDRSKASITSELSLGDSSGGNKNTVDVNGSRDRDWETRINTPWVYDNWRGFVQHDNRWSDLGTQDIQDNRLGAGVEWSSERRDGWLLFSQRFPQGRHAGVSAGWSQWLNDNWQYGFSGSTDSMAIPLRALATGLSANDANLNLRWRQDESRSAYLNLGMMNIDDGNHRQTVSLGGSQRLFDGDYYITTGGLDLYHESNSHSGVVYYNPKDLNSVSLRIRHDWVTWRTYDQSFTQNFQAALGLTDEAGYSTAPTLDLLYQHTWQLNRTWRLHYGVAWGTHVYSGDRERRVSGTLGFEGVF